MEGSLRYPAAELADVAGLPSFLRTVPPLLPEVLACPEDFDPEEGLLTLWGLAVARPACPWVFVGVSGLRTARGPPEPPTASRPRPSRANPVDPSFRRRTRLPSSGWTEIFVPAGLRFGALLVMLIRFRLLSESPRSALAAMCGSLR
jgi:hypothetical protein